VAALGKLRAILSAAQAQVTIALEEAAKFPTPPRGEPCPRCGVIRPAGFLPAHLFNVHGIEASSCLVTEGSVAGANGLTTLEAGDDQ